ncbi:MAG: helix-turn-helix domain-containing protein [Geminicoccaceae bacterium]
MNDAAEITPIAETRDTVTLRRADYQALLDALEDAADVAALREAEAAVQRGKSELLPIEMVERLLAGEAPVRVWRTHRGLTAHELARVANLAPSYLSEIETGKKPGSFDAMARLARVLGVAMEDLAPADALDAKDSNGP